MPALLPRPCGPLWQPAPVQSEANSAAGDLLALKFSPREVPGAGGGISLCARAGAVPHRQRTAATAALRNRNFGRVRRFIFDNDQLHAGRIDADQGESGV